MEKNNKQSLLFIIEVCKHYVTIASVIIAGIFVYITKSETPIVIYLSLASLLFLMLCAILSALVIQSAITQAEVGLYDINSKYISRTFRLSMISFYIGLGLSFVFILTDVALRLNKNDAETQSQPTNVECVNYKTK